MVQLENVVACYGTHKALDGITICVNEGDRVGLVGRNGAGKTTLLFLLFGLHQPAHGRVEVCGHDIDDQHSLRKVRRLAGMVFQNADDHLFSGSVYQDVAFGPLHANLTDKEIDDRVQRALHMVDMLPARDRVAHHLSAGEKRRVALATVLAMQPELLVLDEPTSGLDPKGRRNLIGLLRAIGKTQLIASHDLEFVLETCSLVKVMDGGRIVAQGPTGELLADGELMEAAGLEVPYSLR